MQGEERLVTASVLEERGILKRGTAYKMAKAQLIPCHFVGVRRRGIRFILAEVLEALRCPVGSASERGGTRSSGTSQRCGGAS
jgi:hypothetical protein